MKIAIAGKDRSADLGPVLAADARERARDPSHVDLPWSLHALSLRDQKTGSAYFDHYLELLRRKNHVDTLNFDIPHRPGLGGRAWMLVKKVLWKVLRYQHARMAFRQNLINSHLTSALEYQRDLARKEVGELKRRIAALEAKLSNRGGAP